MLTAKAGIPKSDKLVFMIRIRRHDRPRLTTNNRCIDVDIVPDKDLNEIVHIYVSFV